MKNRLLFGLVVFSLLLSFPSVFAGIQASNLEAYYGFDTNPTDSTSNGRNLGLNGSVNFNQTFYKLGNASGGGFATTTGYFSRTDENWQDAFYYGGGGTGGTVRVWIYDTSGTTWGGIMEKRSSAGNGANNLLFIHDTGQVISHSEFQDGSFRDSSSSGAILANRWYHVAAVFYTNNSVYFYVNGSLAGIGSYTGTHATQNTEFKIGNSVGGLPFNGFIDEVAFWNTTLTAAEIDQDYANGSGCDYECLTTSDAGINTIALTLNNNITGNTFGGTAYLYNLTGDLTFTWFNITESGFCVNYTGNGTGYNCTASGSGSATYFTTTKSKNVTTSETIEGTTYQAILNITTQALYTNSIINAFNVTNNKLTNTTTSTTVLIKAINGSNNIRTDVAGNYTLNQTCTVTTPLTITPCNITGVYDNKFTIGAKYLTNSVLSFNTTVKNTTTTFSLNNQTSTSTGAVTFNLLQGYTYFFLMNASGYALENASLPANASTNTYNFSLLIRDTFDLTFKNETSDTILNNQIVYVELISESYAANYTTTNGSLIVSLLTPDTYTIRYWIDPDVPREYYATLTSQSYQNLTLYVIDTDISSFYLPVVYNQNNQPFSSVQIQLLRYFVNSNSYKVVEMSTTDTNGQAVLRVVPNIINYKLLLSADGVTLTTSPTKFTASTNTYVLSLTQNALTSIAALPSVGATLYYVNSTQTYVFTWADTSNIVTSGCLYVQKSNSTGSYEVNNQCENAASGSLIYTITDTNDTLYSATAKITTNTEFSEYGFGPVTASFKTALQSWGLIGVLLFVIILSTMGFMSNESGTDSLVITTVLGIALMGLVGFITRRWEVIIGIAIIGGVLVYKTKQ